MDQITNTERLIHNDRLLGKRISYELLMLLKKCDSFDFSVAFINKEALAMLKQAFLELQDRGVKARLVTSTYLGFNNPEMFEELLKFDFLDVRVFTEQGFHPKGYIFKEDHKLKTIVGSANLTSSALTTNQEWNIYVEKDIDDPFSKDVLNAFNQQYEHSIPLTKEWIEEYKKVYVKPTTEPHKYFNGKEVEPNKMQREALFNLEELRNNGADKALLISATGTGKTYLSAFDVRSFKAKKMLFVVHRRTIAIKAMETFKTLLPNVSMGLFSGSKKELECDYLFSTVQTISKEENLALFNNKYFDYIIIDEVHRAGARTYQDLLEYFSPKFLLGMTATPERTDGFDIYKLFDYNIAYEIRLQDAMEYDLLCPFHYKYHYNKIY